MNVLMFLARKLRTIHFCVTILPRGISAIALCKFNGIFSSAVDYMEVEKKELRKKIEFWSFVCYVKLEFAVERLRKLTMERERPVKTRARKK